MSSNNEVGGRKPTNKESPHQGVAPVQKVLFGVTPKEKPNQSSQANNDSSNEEILPGKENGDEEILSGRLAESKDPSLAFMSEFPSLLAIGLNQSQMARFELDPILGYEAAETLQEFANKSWTAQSDLAEANRTIAALRQIVFNMLGWTDQFTDQAIANAIDIAASNEVEAMGPFDESASSSSGNLNSSVIVSNSAPLRISSITVEQMHQFADYLRRCIAEGVDDKRASVLSQEAVIQLHRAFLTKSDGRVPIGSTYKLWMSSTLWPTERLAQAVECTFRRAGSTSLDWLHQFDKLFVELDVKNESSYIPYLNGITTTEVNAQYRNTPEKQVVKTLVTNLVKPPKDKAGNITRCNKQMHSEMHKLASEHIIDTIEQYVVQFGACAARANRSIEQAALWDNALDHPTSLIGKRGIYLHDSAKVPRLEHAVCQGCGYELPAYIDANVTHQECRRCCGHPDRNTSGPWDKSAAFTILRNKGFKTLNRKYRLSGELVNATTLAEMDSLSHTKHPQPFQHNHGGGRGGPQRGGRLDGRGRGRF